MKIILHENEFLFVIACISPQ